MEFGFEIGLKSGARRRVILFCKVAEGCTEFPAGTALLSQMLGGDKGCRVWAPIPLDAIWRDLASARQPNTPKLKPDILRYSPEYIYWLHPADYDAGRCVCCGMKRVAHVTGRKTSVGVARSGGDSRQGERRGHCTDPYAYHDARIRIEYNNGKPQALDVYRHGELELKVLSVIWNDDSDAVIVLHRGKIVAAVGERMLIR